MPGKMYHTNEVMVLLGDNWFAKRTCKQALEIAERRKQCMWCVHVFVSAWGVVRVEGVRSLGGV